jgi:hypothetical protein
MMTNMSAEDLNEARPGLTFACELDRARLAPLLADGVVINDLRALGARVALMVSDFSDERAEFVRQLNGAGIPVVGIPLVPLEEGYYFTADNAPVAAGRYEEWRTWTKDHGLVWDGVGLDIEPDARIYRQIIDNPWGLVPMLLPRLFDRQRPGLSRAAYQQLVEHIRADGWSVENYQFPLIAEERQVGSTMLQRLALVDVRTDREVWMLYSSFMRGVGPDSSGATVLRRRRSAWARRAVARTFPTRRTCQLLAGRNWPGICYLLDTGVTTF